MESRELMRRSEQLSNELVSSSRELRKRLLYLQAELRANRVGSTQLAQNATAGG